MGYSPIGAHPDYFHDSIAEEQADREVRGELDGFDLTDAAGDSEDLHKALATLLLSATLGNVTSESLGDALKQYAADCADFAVAKKFRQNAQAMRVALAS